jgi:hypothetical protein
MNDKKIAACVDTPNELMNNIVPLPINNAFRVRPLSQSAMASSARSWLSAELFEKSLQITF